MTLVERIKSLADQRKISISELERKTNMGNGTIGRWNEKTPGVDKVQKVADYFNVSTDYLLGREEIKMTESDLSRMIDNAMSFDGKPLSENDREIARAYLEGKFGLK